MKDQRVLNVVLKNNSQEWEIKSSSPNTREPIQLWMAKKCVVEVNPPTAVSETDVVITPVEDPNRHFYEICGNDPSVPVQATLSGISMLDLITDGVNYFGLVLPKASRVVTIGLDFTDMSMQPAEFYSGLVTSEWHGETLLDIAEIRDLKSFDGGAKFGATYETEQSAVGLRFVVAWVWPD